MPEPTPTSTPHDPFRSGLNSGASSVYRQHPGSARLDDLAIIPGVSSAPLTLGESASWLYDQLRKPRTQAELVALLLEGPFPDAATTAASIESVLRELVGHGLLVEIAPGSPLPSDVHALSRHLLVEAQRRLRAGDWAEAEALAREAGRNPAFAAVAELDTLIARYHGGKLDGMVEQACLLSAQMTPPAQTSCDALAMLAAHRTGDLAAAKRIALFLTRRFQSPWDLPTVPQFAVWVRGLVVVTESISADPMLAVVEDLLAARVGTADEVKQIEALAQRYRDRRTPSGQT